jgi:hypothetical protein
MIRDDIGALRIPLVALAITLFIASGGIAYSNAVRDDAQRLLTQRKTRLEQERLRIRNAAAEKEMIAHYAEPYEVLVRTGFAGEEQRMTWLDSLRLANEQARTLGVEYVIGAQRPYTYAAEFATAPFQLNESLMQVKLGLLHEEDLTRFLDALAGTSGGFFTIDRCVLRRLQPGEIAATARVQQNVVAECDLRWLTARLAAEKKR